MKPLHRRITGGHTAEPMLYCPPQVLRRTAIGDDRSEEKRMSINEHQTGDFIPYPTNRVVGTIADTTDARAALASLLNGGFQPSEIDILHGEKDLHRLDPTGAEHGFLAQFQRI